MSVFILFACFIAQPIYALDLWSFQKLADTPRLTKNRVFLNTAADLDGNGRKEIVVADFGDYGPMVEPPWMRPTPRQFNLFVYEWDPSAKKLVQRLRKHWDTEKVRGTDADVAKYFSAWRAKNMLAFGAEKFCTKAKTIPCTSRARATIGEITWGKIQ